MRTARTALRVGVVGMGTAGLAASIFLSRAGHSVDVFERTRSDLEKPVGAGLGIQPIGLSVLFKLGVLPEVLRHGSRIERLHSLTKEGRVVLDLRYADFRPELYGVGLHRDTLFSALTIEPSETNTINFFTGTNGPYRKRSKPPRAKRKCLASQRETDQTPSILAHTI